MGLINSGHGFDRNVNPGKGSEPGPQLDVRKAGGDGNHGSTAEGCSKNTQWWFRLSPWWFCFHLGCGKLQKNITPTLAMTTSWIIYQIMSFLEPIREPRLQGHHVNGISKREQPFQERPEHPQLEEEAAPHRQVRRQVPKARVGEHVPQPGAQMEKELPPRRRRLEALGAGTEGGSCPWGPAQSPPTYPLPLEV